VVATGTRGACVAAGIPGSLGRTLGMALVVGGARIVRGGHHARREYLGSSTNKTAVRYGFSPKRAPMALLASAARALRLGRGAGGWSCGRRGGRLCGGRLAGGRGLGGGVVSALVLARWRVGFVVR